MTEYPEKKEYFIKKKRLWLIPIGILAAGAALFVAVYLLLITPMPELAKVAAPEGAQLLLFPMDRGLVVAGYYNQNYLESKGYPHYGLDLTSYYGRRDDILASGSGTVLGSEFCDNSLGNITVIRYDNVFLPNTGETLPLIARYYHMDTLLVAEGDQVVAGQVIGTIHGLDKWYNHVHIEFDTDVAFPFHTPQVAQASSQLLSRYPADGSTIVDPIHVLVVGKNQRITAHRASNSWAGKDLPKYGVG